MPRRKRVCTGGYVFHVLNRAVARERIFDDEGDYKAFEKVLREAIERVPVRVLSFSYAKSLAHGSLATTRQG